MILIDKAVEDIKAILEDYNKLVVEGRNRMKGIDRLRLELGRAVAELTSVRQANQSLREELLLTRTCLSKAQKVLDEQVLVIRGLKACIRQEAIQDGTLTVAGSGAQG